MDSILPNGCIKVTTLLKSDEITTLNCTDRAPVLKCKRLREPLRLKSKPLFGPSIPLTHYIQPSSSTEIV